MAVTNPAAFLQNAGATHTAEVTRNAFNGMISGARAAASLIPRGGVHPALGTQLAVTQQGSPAMGVTVGTGHIFVPGTEGTSQGGYNCYAATTTNLSISAAHASLARIDIVVAKVEDSVYSGATNAWSLAVVTGTAAGSPAVPSAPANSVILAHVAVAANATTIVNANITDKRPYIAMGIIPVATPADLPSVAFDGMFAFSRSNDSLYFHDGVTWQRNTERYNGICKLFGFASQNVSDSTDTVLNFGASHEELDTDGWHDTVTNNSRITPNVPGYFRVTASGYWAFNNTMLYSDCFVRKSGSVVARMGNLQLPSTGQNNISKWAGSVSEIFTANGSSDYFEMGLRHTSTGGVTQSTNAGASTSPRFTVEFLRPL
jgi:hypothetical protein